ncbi:MAG: hypothetical protein HQL87_13765 [Magnetococcales bacterium]|nr:hypothetical protein [Magnetococcales bacterium]
MKTTRKWSGLVGMLGWVVCAGLPASGLTDAPPEAAPESPHSFTANVGGVSNYIFRGLTQTWNKPAIQGGVDYAHTDGWYAGLWASSISDKQYAGGWAETDYYGGYNGKFNDDWTWTLGLLGVYYPSANYDRSKPAGNHQSYDNFEVNAGVGYKWVSLKLSASLTDYFGANTSTGYKGDTKGTTYLDLSANVPLPEETFTKDVTVPLHIGRTHYTSDLASKALAGGTDPDYTDYKAGLSKAFDGGWSLGVAYTYADNGAVYSRVSSAKNASDILDLGGGNVVISLTKTF